MATVAWSAPALNTVLSRYSEDEVRHVLNYGRNNVMPAWGAPGGGPLTPQQLDYLIYYLRRIQIPESELREIVDTGVREGIAEHLGVSAHDGAVDEWLGAVDAVVEEARAMALAADESLADKAEAIRDEAIRRGRSGAAGCRRGARQRALPDLWGRFCSTTRPQAARTAAPDVTPSAGRTTPRPTATTASTATRGRSSSPIAPAGASSARA